MLNSNELLDKNYLLNNKIKNKLFSCSDFNTSNTKKVLITKCIYNEFKLGFSCKYDFNTYFLISNSSSFSTVNKRIKFFIFLDTNKLILPTLYFYIKFISCSIFGSNFNFFLFNNIFKYFVSGGNLSNVKVSFVDVVALKNSIFKFFSYKGDIYSSNKDLLSFFSKFKLTYNYVYLFLMPKLVSVYKDELNSSLLERKERLSNVIINTTNKVFFTPFFYKVINKFFKNGKKDVSIYHFLSFLYFHKLNNLVNKSYYVLGHIFDVISPKFKLVNSKYRGRNRQVPKLISHKQAILLGISIFKSSLVNRKEKGFLLKIYSELLDIYSLKGNSFKLKENNYKLALANRNLLFRRSGGYKSKKVYSFDKNNLYFGK